MRVSLRLRSEGMFCSAVSIAGFAGFGLLLLAVNHGLYSQYLSESLGHSGQATFVEALSLGSLSSLSTFLIVLTYLEFISRHRSSSQVHLFAVATLGGLIVCVLGAFESYVVPGMLNPLNFLDVLILAAIVSLASFFLLQRSFYENQEKEILSARFARSELKLFHAETLEELRTLIWAAVVPIAGFVLFGIISFPTGFQSAEGEQAAEKVALLWFSYLSYLILGYGLLCLLPLYERLHWIRLKIRGLH